MEETTLLNSANAAYLEALYESYLEQPETVDPGLHNWFEKIRAGATNEKVRSRIEQQFAGFVPAKNTPAGAQAGEHKKQNSVLNLINNYRHLGHLAAKLSPIQFWEAQPVPGLSLDYHHLDQSDLQREFSPGLFPLPKKVKLAEIESALKQTYCGTIGAEYRYLSEQDEVNWIRERLEADRATPSFDQQTRRRILRGLIATEGLEKYLHRTYVGQKRFSLEGGDSLIPLVDDLIQHVGAQGVKEVVIGMAHRGRLNVLVNILGKNPRDLFSEFEDRAVHQGSGDVKYHQGFSADLVTPGGTTHVTLSFNPSHLEIINPVVEGSVRARQERREDWNRKEVMPLLIHGDAALAGQGVVMETLSLSATKGYSTGGSIHVVVNNQIGFTTSNPHDARSTLYCTDIAKMIQAPIFHVNGDDPEAVVYISRLAIDYRARFNKDVVIDIVCYRRHGHNEADEPAITQPNMYKKIKKHPRVLEIYKNKLSSSDSIKKEEQDQLEQEYVAALQAGECVALAQLSPQRPVLAINWEPYIGVEWTAPGETRISQTQLQLLGKRLTSIPDYMELHPRVAKVIGDRQKMTGGEIPIDWGFAESLAYASLLTDGYRVRLSGQDSGRGTFSHRHAVLHNQNPCQPDQERYIPLQYIQENQPRFLVIDSLLSEEAVLAFEYGYASADPETLVVWEAQFGDFVNGAQVVIDQFISSSEAKWERLCAMVMLLPHGFEGQGPEHSSARLERFLQLCAEQNMQVCVPSTPAQLFHFLRRQMRRPMRKPLIVMSPKSLLRHKASVSQISDLIEYPLHLVIGDYLPDPEEVKRVVMCSGKVYFDLDQARRDQELKTVAIIRIEQLYPFPSEDLRGILSRYPNATEVVWAQEEPQNQGAWYQSKHHFSNCLRPNQRLKYAGRMLSAAPAVGSHEKHLSQQRVLVEDALTIWDEPQEINTKKARKAKG